MVFKSILEIISFLTIIPIGKLNKSDGLENISKGMFLFPFIGLLIGLLTLPVVLISFYFFNQFVSAFIVTIFLIVLTGIHHTDALADFADGIMVRGNKDKKYKVMHDPRIGSAGTVAVSGYFIGMVIAISSITSLERLMIAIILSEIMSKYSMVLQSHYCESAWDGYSSLFTKNMKSKKKMAIATIITTILILLISNMSVIGLQIFIVGIICCLVVIYISKKNFGGITGDVMGATNEIVRLCSLLSLS
ncbi:adenosylcobinamide-GDP ribazoletransferase [Candidatus Nitrosocosmicus arcticus]|uniref:Adenosylcobinamide-GDP ribazoletransferase n=1 Tax=Candidatus Nitrosocosmicus arcticus TaxID=2035267 RepID=A0A557SXL1_9ARCH|nr:adenosylcobinamide-GDP ribazoletransferase [Candidatus Nitrosocosmicus arcticus]TVP41346.1 cobalamin-5-phosphate synthase [Candidatus Nitrosocosmicus arcticus]